MAMQVSGTLLIAWRTIGTPKTIDTPKSRDDLLLMLFYVLVESGCLVLVTELVGTVFNYRDQVDALVVIAIVGQLSVGFESSSSIAAG